MENPFPVVTIEGTARERGVMYGDQAADQISDAIGGYKTRFERAVGLDRSGARTQASAYEGFIKNYDAETWEEMCGIALGADVALEDIIALNCRSELLFAGHPILECTAFGLQPEVTDRSSVYVGQNWDWAPEIVDTLIVLIIRQEPRPTIFMLTEAGMIGRMGMNTAGIAMATNTLLSETQRSGVPYNVILRGVLNSSNMAGAIRAIVKPRRAIAANFLLGDSRGQVLDIESSPDHIDYVAPVGGVLAHGNHFAGVRLSGRDLSLERFPDSLYRECRLRDALAAKIPQVTEEDMEGALRDTFGAPNGISREVDGADLPHERLETVASIIMNPGSGDIRLTKGSPVKSKYVGLTLTDYGLAA